MIYVYVWVEFSIYITLLLRLWKGLSKTRELVNTGCTRYLREALGLETRVKGVIFFLSFCIGGTSEKRENRNKIQPNSPRDLILGSFPLPHTSLSVLVGIRVLPKIGQNMEQSFFRKAYIVRRYARKTEKTPKIADFAHFESLGA